ncbi:MAG TPA: hypothetical protein VN816_05355 [Acidimicrobiales bacterium]|nr:hypothetical protein [Acidimicrobiales bacterium]
MASRSGGGTSVHWHSTFDALFPGSGWMPRRSIGAFLQRCADGLAAASSHSNR